MFSKKNWRNQTGLYRLSPARHQIVRIVGYHGNVCLWREYFWNSTLKHSKFFLERKIQGKEYKTLYFSQCAFFSGNRSARTKVNCSNLCHFGVRKRGKNFKIILRELCLHLNQFKRRKTQNIVQFHQIENGQLWKFGFYKMSTK